jgi:hypothetical protein
LKISSDSKLWNTVFIGKTFNNGVYEKHLSVRLRIALVTVQKAISVFRSIFRDGESGVLTCELFFPVFGWFTICGFKESFVCCWLWDLVCVLWGPQMSSFFRVVSPPLGFRDVNNLPSCPISSEIESQCSFD